MNKNRLQYAVIATALVNLIACSSAPSERIAAAKTEVVAASSASGVQGSLMLSPGCPGPQVAGRNCDRVLPNHTIELLDERGGVIARTTSGTDGGFAMQAPPGQYTLQVVRQGLYPRCPALPVTIVAGSMANGSLTCDSGMR